MSDSFSDWAAKIAEAYCVENNIPCKRKFTDMELERPRQEVRNAKHQLSDIYADQAIKRDKETPQWLRELRTGAIDRPVGG